MQSLFRSRKFWIAVCTFVVDIALLLVHQYVPGQEEFVKALLGPINGLAMVVIGGIALEDAGAKASGVFPPQG